MSEIWVPKKHHRIAVDFMHATPYDMTLLDCGMGKTSCAGTVMTDTLLDFDISRWLVIGPKRVAYKSWPDEFAKWEHLSTWPYRCLTAQDFGLTPQIDASLRFDEASGEIVDDSRKRGLTFRLKRDTKKHLLSLKQSIHFVSFDFLPWLVEAYGANWPYDGVVIDESSFVKNWESKRWRALRKIRPKLARLIELTGTPSPNGLEDLWSQAYLVDQGQRLGQTLGAFRDAYFTPDKRGPGGVIYSRKPDEGAREKIFARLKDVALSMDAVDWIDLPKLIHNPIMIELPKAARDAYDTLEHELIVMLTSGRVKAANAAVMGNKLLQMASGHVYDDERAVHHLHDAKLDALEELADCTAGSMLVGYGYKPDAQAILKRFGKHAKLISRDSDIDAWNKGKIKLGLAHPASLGHGINLQSGGNMAVYYSPTFNAEWYYQFYKRLQRPGQKHDHVIVSAILAEGTMDRAVWRAAQGKLDEQSVFLAAMGERINELRSNTTAVDQGEWLQ